MPFLRDLRELDWKKIKNRILFYLIVVGIIVLILMFIFHILEFWISFSTSLNENTLFTLTNTAIYGVWFVCLGFFNKGIQDNLIRILFVLILIVFFMTGLGFLNFCLRINLWFMNETFRTYCTGSADSGYLFIYNELLFIGLIVLTFLTEHEIKTQKSTL